MGWKKLIVDGASADLSNIDVTNSVTASYFKGDGSQLTNVTVSQVQTIKDTFTNATSKTITHNFDSDNLNISVYDSNGAMIFPASAILTNSNTVNLTFDSATSGHAVVSRGGHIVSGSTGWDYISNIPSGLVSSSISGDAQGQIKVNGTNINVNGVLANSSPTFADLTLTGDLTVQGTTTSIQTTNLLVQDKFILINSGSGASDGGLVVDGAGVALGWDSSENRWSFDSAGAVANQNTISTDAFIPGVVDIDAGHSDIAAYQKNGNIKTDSGDIYIYS